MSKNMKRFFRNIEARVAPVTVFMLLLLSAFSAIFVVFPIVEFGSAGDNWNIVHTFTDCTTDSNGISFSPDGNYLAFGEAGDTYSVFVKWVGNWTSVVELTNASDEVRSTAWSTDGMYLAATSNDDNVYIFNASDGFSNETVITSSSDNVCTVAFSSSYIAFGTDEQKVRVHYVGNWTEAHVITVSYDVQSIAFNSDGSLIAFSEEGASVGSLRVNYTSNWTSKFDVTTENIKGVAFSPDDVYVAACNWDDDDVHVYYVSNGSQATTLELQSSDPHYVCFSMSGNFIAYGGRDYDVNIHYVGNWSLVTSLSEPTNYVYHVSFSSDDQYIGVCCNDASVYIYNTTLPVYGGSVASSFSLSGLDGSDRITWSGEAGDTVYSNASYPGGTLEINYNVNASDNCTEIRINLSDISAVQGILNSNISLQFDSDNSSFTGDWVAYSGTNCTINESEWSSHSWGGSPFPIDGEGWTNGTIYVHFRLSIDSGASAGTYTVDTWKVWFKVES